MSKTDIATTQVKYCSYNVYQKLVGLSDANLDVDRVVADIEATIKSIETHGVEVRGLYDVSGFRAEDDIMIWLTGEDPEQMQKAIREFENSEAAAGLDRVWQAMGVHQIAEFARAHMPSFMDPDVEPRKWITVYPFTRSYEWYILEEEERSRMLREHGMLGRQYPNVNSNTVAAFALGDYEWLLSFEADELTELVDMMRSLRYTDARLHVRDELPFHTGRLFDDIKDMAGVLL